MTGDHHKKLRKNLVIDKLLRNIFVWTMQTGWLILIFWQRGKDTLGQKWIRVRGISCDRERADSQELYSQQCWVKLRTEDLVEDEGVKLAH